jgi:hypothetical protein
MAQYHVKNGSHVAKAFKVRGGHQIVPAGREANVVDAKELTEAQIDAFARDGVKVKLTGKGSAIDAEVEPKTAAEVLAMANDPAVPFMTFKSAAAKLLGDAVPAKKPEIIAALEELATKP